MTIEAWTTVAIVGMTISVLALELAAPEVVMLTALAALMVTGVLTPEQAASGFGSVAVLTIAALFVVAAGIRRTGVLVRLADIVLGKGLGGAPLLRLLVPASVFSAFLNNTPIVAMFVPTVLDWCKRNDVRPSRLLMPLSFATMMGGTCSLIGTSTVLVVDGMLRQQNLAAMRMFETAWVGIPLTVAGILILWLLSPIFLPERRDPVANLTAERREYIVETLVEQRSPLVGKRIADVGLRRLPGLFLLTIERHGRFLGPVAPSEVLRGEDRLVFTGIASTVADLRRFRGLTPAPEAHYDPTAERRTHLFEVVVSETSPLVGTTVRDVHFRSRYDAAVIAIHRAGERLPRKLGNVVLRPGDTLMLEASEDFDVTWTDSSDFALVSRVRGEPPPKLRKAKQALMLVAALILVVTFEVLPMAVAGLLTAGAMIFAGVLTPREARKALNLPILLVAGAALGMGHAMETSGLAERFADGLIGIGGTFGPVGILAATYLAGMLLTELVTNVAAAALVFPVAMQVAERSALDPRPFAIAIVVAASASFLTPTGYQTNLMVYGPGGYRFTDFARLGLPLSICVFCVTMVIVPLVWPLTS